MKKHSAIIISAAFLVSSCTTGAGTGAYAGSSLGSVLGSAIGGIVGGPHGSDIGTIVGMAGGAAVGGAIGNAADQQQRREQSEVLARRNQRIQREKARHSQSMQYGDDTYATGGNASAYSSQSTNIDLSQMVDENNSGDDRIDFGAQPAPSGSNTTGTSRVETIRAGSISDGKLTIRNVRFSDETGDGKLSGDETGRVTFEIYNNTEVPIYDFDPTVVEAEANKRIYISPSVHVENIMPGQGLRYTATIKADRRIKDGQIRLLVSVQKAGKPISYVTVVKVDTLH